MMLNVQSVINVYWSTSAVAGGQSTITSVNVEFWSSA